MAQRAELSPIPDISERLAPILFKPFPLELASSFNETATKFYTQHSLPIPGVTRGAGTLTAYAFIPTKYELEEEFVISHAQPAARLSQAERTFNVACLKFEFLDPSIVGKGLSEHREGIEDYVIEGMALELKYGPKRSSYRAQLLDDVGKTGRQFGAFRRRKNDTETVGLTLAVPYTPAHLNEISARIVWGNPHTVPQDPTAHLF